MTMVKKYSILILLLTLVAGCGHAVKHTVSTEHYRLKPHTVALLPVVWKGDAKEAEKNEVSLVFNDMVAEKVRSLGYAVTVVDEDDARAADAATTPPAELARRFGAETVMYSSITGWDTDQLETYAALTLRARFNLYSANGSELWKAEHTSKKSDLRLDKRPMEIAIIDAWEPKVQRFIDIVFATLPRSETPAGAQEKYFDWLP